VSKPKHKGNIKVTINKPVGIPASVVTNRDASFWKGLAEYNLLDTQERAEGLKKLGLMVDDDEILRILTKSHFVIPGVTRYTCQTCGECCRYARKIAPLTYESCSFLDEHNKCSKHGNRYLVCKWFPFWIYHDQKLGDILTIKPYCSGYGKGELVDYQQTLNYIKGLSVMASNDDDGAVVIHELLHLPGAREWVFPSKSNIDKLLALIPKTGLKNNRKVTLEGARVGELNYAQFITSGLLGSVKDPQLTIDENSLITDVNESFCQLVRQERSSLIGCKLSSLAVNQEDMLNDINTCLYKGKATAMPHRIRTGDDATLPVLFSAMVFRDRTDGLIHGALVCIKETTKIIYNELAQSKNYVRGLIEASLDPFMVIGLDGVLTDVNQAMVQMTGCSRSELIGSLFSHHFIDPLLAQQGVDSTFHDGQVKNYELVLKTAASERVPVSFNATVFKNYDGHTQGIFAVARDIRDTQKIMNQLEESRNYARGLIESSIDLMVTVNCDGIITDVNEAAVELTGYKREKLIGSPFQNYFTIPLKAFQGISLAFIQGKVKGYELELINHRGEKIMISFNASVYKNKEGTVLGVFAIARDMRNK